MRVPMSVGMVVAVTVAVMPVVIVAVIIHRIGALRENRDRPQCDRKHKEHRERGHHRTVPGRRRGHREAVGGGQSGIIVMVPVSGLRLPMGTFGLLGRFRVMLRMGLFMVRIGVVVAGFLIIMLDTYECRQCAAEARIRSLPQCGGADSEHQRDCQEAEC